MKWIPIVLLASLIAGCDEVDGDVRATSNPNLPVTLMFEIDGMRVYRFKDGGDYHYVADARGVAITATTTTDTDVDGTTTSNTTYDEVPTVGRPRVLTAEKP